MKKALVPYESTRQELFWHCDRGCGGMSIFQNMLSSQRCRSCLQATATLRKGRTGRAEFFDTPAEVELAKAVHACRATPSVEMASSKFLRDVPFLQAEPDSLHPLGVWQLRSPPVLPFPHHNVCTNLNPKVC